jgi:hypothetical protein
LEFGLDEGSVVGVLQDLDDGPGGLTGGGFVAGEHEGHEEVGDDFVFDGAAVFVGFVDDVLQEVAVIVRVLAAVVNNGLEDGAHGGFGAVAAAEFG